MNPGSEQISQKLKDAGMKVTPQRHAILEALYEMNNHPTAENITEYIRKTHPGVATGTVYHVLDALVQNGLVQKVKTDKDVMRYEATMANHHHIYNARTERIEDYFDKELDELLQVYFQKKKLPNFKIDKITLQINGAFTDNSK
jgi:Fur family transcriptional regulator, peroxide stress response regulator